MADTWEDIAKRLRTEAPDRVLMLKGAIAIEALAEELLAPAHGEAIAGTGGVREALQAAWDYFHAEPGLDYGPHHPSHKIGAALAFLSREELGE